MSKPQSWEEKRNVHLLEWEGDHDLVLAGIVASRGITFNHLWRMVPEVFRFTMIDFWLFYEGGTMVPMNNDQLPAGRYFIVTNGNIIRITDPIITSTPTAQNHFNRSGRFRNDVRTRDGRCVVSGCVVPRTMEYDGYEAAHIYPIAYHHNWANDSHQFKLLPEGESIDSMRNGIFLREDIHTLFDRFIFSIDVDDNYKVIYFRIDTRGIAGNRLPQSFIDNPHRPSDNLFRWHFKQAVLRNMRGY
ncbi:hypothetical protein B9Z19DRAFT_1134579 [Tuber borchii]|uniref:Uncharacterized protein n=1 Tax=Tuber borchii TaxID=42251 RepID=A0A2T6ZDZ5_TUBBO|nr:hypothetical protein B9Z19DRAFT_1134579 [Tuber borchii]